jgi:hypothetical protein
MSEGGGLAGPAPMEGEGAYNRSSRVQAAGLAPAIDLFATAARAVPLPPDGPVVLADYGCSQGHNSLRPISTALEALRARIGPEPAVSVVHTDLPGNDFTALFATLAHDPESYLRFDPKTFPMAIGRSFYQPILPPESVLLGWSNGGAGRRRRSPIKSRSPTAAMARPGRPTPDRGRRIGGVSSKAGAGRCSPGRGWWS